MQDRLITELKLIGRYSRHNEAEDARFVARIKCGSESDESLDGVVRAEAEYVSHCIDCTACANCCKVLQVSVDDADIARLARHRGMSAKQFTAKHTFVDSSDHGRYMKAIPCMFLGEDNRCTIYEDRPQSCRDYPYLFAGAFRSRAGTMSLQVSTCPIVFNVWSRLKQRLHFGRRR